MSQISQENTLGGSLFLQNITNFLKNSFVMEPIWRLFLVHPMLQSQCKSVVTTWSESPKFEDSGKS